MAVINEGRVICHIPFRFPSIAKETGIFTHFISKPTNKGLVEVCGKAVNRGGGLGIEKCVLL